MESISESLKFYRRVCHEGLCKALEATVSTEFSRSSVYCSGITIWLMIFQRLNNDHSLSAAVEELQRGTFDELLDSGSLQARSGKISGATGGYSRARKRLDTKLVNETVDRLNTALIESHKKQTHKDRRVFLVDGSSLRIPATKENLSVFKQFQNQHGKAHYPLVRFSVITDAVTGVALRPAYGSFNGNKAVGELSLFDELLPLVPDNSILIGDRCYGCPRTVDNAQEHGHDVIWRIKESTAKKLLGKPPKGNQEKEVTWESKGAYASSPEYAVEGRVLCYNVRRKGYRPQVLFLFTTLPYSIKDIVELYALRWNVELDLRQLKSTLDMDMLTAKSPEMIEKELSTGIAAYNLIRHVMFVSAKILKLQPRDLSFSKVLRRVRGIHGVVMRNAEPEKIERALNFLLNDIKSFKLPKKNPNKPNEPRKIWRKGAIRTMTTSREQERKLIIKKNKAI